MLALLGVGSLVACSSSKGSSATSPATVAPPSGPGEAVVYVALGAPDDSVQQIRDDLLADDRVQGVVYVTSEESYEEFRCLFVNSPDMLASVNADILPRTFRLYVGGDQATIDQVINDYRSRAGVKDAQPMPSRFTPLPAPGSTDPAVPCPDVGEPIK